MSVVLLSIGNELLRGEIANSNAQWLAAQLEQLGLEVSAMETVGDDEKPLVAALGRLFNEHTLLIATGGLGPTSDDATAEAVARTLGVELHSNDEALYAIRRRVEGRGGQMRPGHHKQALVPAGSELLPNTEGTAPGFLVRGEQSMAFFMPGVPHEMKAMFAAHVVPKIKTALNPNSPGALPGLATTTMFHVCLHTAGQGESWLADKLEGLVANHPAVTLRYRARSATVDVRIEARDEDYAVARERATHAAAEVRERLGEAVYAEGDQTLVQLAGRSIRSRGWRLAVAESITGGLIAKQLTSYPASDFFVGAAVAYANTAKTSLLGVSEDTLRGHGAVSAEVAAEMAEGARRVFECDVGISVTGIAGPTGATADKPLGLCYWAVACPGSTVVQHAIFPGNRIQVQHKAAHAALDLLRRTINGQPPKERPSRAGSEELSG